jgi:outer membrane protein TolC
VRIARKELNSFLVYDLGEEFVLDANPDDTSLAGLPPLEAMIDTALEHRPEMLAAKYLTEITHKAINVARSGHFPTLSAVSDLNWQSQSDQFSLQENEFTSWSAGLRLSIPIFDGFATSGRVANSKADYRQQRLAERDTRDKIVLEVEEAYDQLLQAKKALDVQVKTIAQAEKGLRIANVRYESGVGTLLEVLSAQSALTQARNARTEALYFFRDARAQLTKATTTDITVD